MSTEHERGFDAGYSAAIHDARVEGSRAHSELSTGETYNGWKNYETWAVGMYLDGNYDGPYTYYAAIEAVKDTLALDHPTSEYWTADESQRFNVADRLKDFVQEYVNPESYDDDHPDPQLHPLIADLLGASLSSVDWHELADAWIEQVSEQVSA